MSEESSKQPPIALLSDFGIRDEYVAVMKGAIAQINPMLRVIDITHEIPPQKTSPEKIYYKFYDDFMKLFQELYIVDNNSPNSIGGGNPRVQVAPPIGN